MTDTNALPRVGEAWTEEGLRRLAKVPGDPGSLCYVLARLFEELDQRRESDDADGKR
jgi:hypothetical protein